MKKGFTLMEMLAVLLVIAIVLSFAVPAYRSIRYEMYYHRAKTAAVKMAEAIRSYYQQTKGYVITDGSSFTGTGSGTDSVAGILGSSDTCNNPAATGIPSTEGTRTSTVEQLFKCGYLNAKDFVGLPYRFSACDPFAADPDTNCPPANGKQGLVQVFGLEGAGKKFYKPDGSNAEAAFSVKRDLTIKEHEALD